MEAMALGQHVTTRYSCTRYRTSTQGTAMALGQHVTTRYSHRHFPLLMQRQKISRRRLDLSQGLLSVEVKVDHNIDQKVYERGGLKVAKSDP